MGRAFWATTQLQIRLGEVRGSLAQHFVLLLKEAIAAAELAHLSGFFPGGPGLFARLDISLLESTAQGGLADAEVCSDQLQGHVLASGAGDSDDVITELLWVRCGHGAHPLSRAGRP